MRMMPLSILGLCLFLLALALPAAATRTISIGDQGNALALVEAQDDVLRFQVRVGEILASETASREGDFTRLFIPGFHLSQRAGEPELPMMNRLCEIPYGAETQLRILDLRTREIDLAAQGIDLPVLPAQPSVSKSADPTALPFHYQAALYQEDRDLGAEWIKLVDIGWMRAMHIGRIDVAPVRYNPVQHTLTVVEEMTFELAFVGADRAAGDELRAATYSPFFRPVYARITGPGLRDRDPHDDNADLMTAPVKYVIVYDPMFESQLGPFVEWKTRKGFELILASTSEIGASTVQIKDYLQGLYDAGTPENPAPSFVLFMGDVAQIPAWTLGGHHSDLYYCEYTGDRIPEMYYGRFSASNSSQLQAMIDKTLEYEQYLMPDPSYLAVVDLIAGVDGWYASTHGNGQINYGAEHYFNTEHGIDLNLYLYPGSGSADAQIRDDVSDGLTFINYTAHGNVTSWSDPYFSVSHVNALTNFSKYCLAIGNCCLTNSFESTTCFGESWLRATGKGGIGYIGASDYTYWNEDYWWGVGYHHQSQINGTAWPYESTGLGAYDGLWHDHGEPLDNWYMVNDAIIFCGNLAVVESGSNMRNYYWEVYCLMGDPSLATYLGVPTANPVSHAAALVPGATTITVGADPGSYIGLTQDGVIVGCGEIDLSGSAEITLAGIGLGSVEIVVTCQNRQPYSALIPVGGGTAADAGTPPLLRLERNWPNPFNPKTQIAFELPRAMNVELSVFDSAGRRVCELASGMLPAGSHVLVWDGNDDAGRAAPSGVYFYRLDTGEQQFTQKMLLLK